jgi:hypothetical protein
MTLVTCAQCQNFTSGDKAQRFDRSGARYGTYQGAGDCAPFTEFLAKNPSKAAIINANNAMGNKLLLPDIERSCTKFLSK